jgi:hypothetical protein
MLTQLENVLSSTFNCLAERDVKNVSSARHTQARSIPVSKIVPLINEDLTRFSLSEPKRPEVTSENRKWLAFKVGPDATESDHLGHVPSILYNYAISAARSTPLYGRGQTCYVLTCGFILDDMVPACVAKLELRPHLIRLPDWYKLHRSPKNAYLFFNSAVIGASNDPDMPITAFHVRQKVLLDVTKKYRKPPGMGHATIGDTPISAFDAETGLSRPMLSYASSGLWAGRKPPEVKMCRRLGFMHPDPGKVDPYRAFFKALVLSVSTSIEAKLRR